jgi:hypothetical protein
MDIVKDLNEKAVRQLVAAHRQMTDEPLILAVRYSLDDPKGHIHLLEVLDRFPGADDDELLVTEFGPSANLLIVGDLHLALGSPAQVRSATKRRDPVSMAAKGGEVVFDDGSVQAAELKRELGL